MNRLESVPDLSPAERRLLPNLLGIGAPKAATTWLAGVLSGHADIFMPPQKELNALHYEDFYARLPEYLNYFAEWRGQPIRCDFSVRYLASPRAMLRAEALMPEAKLLVCLRNPVEQVQSHYWHLRRQNFHQPAPVQPVPDIFQALERFPAILLEPALYGKHIARWLDHFPRDQLFVVTQEALRDDPQAELDRLCRFLGIAPDPSLLGRSQSSRIETRQGVQPRSPAFEKLYASLYASFARGPYMWLKRSAGVKMADMLKRRLRLRPALEAMFFKEGYPVLDEGGRERLLGYFRDDMMILEKKVGMSFANWHGSESEKPEAARRGVT